jgi:hypothetical protein
VEIACPSSQPRLSFFGKLDWISTQVLQQQFVGSTNEGMINEKPMGMVMSSVSSGLQQT